MCSKLLFIATYLYLLSQRINYISRGSASSKKFTLSYQYMQIIYISNGQYHYDCVYTREFDCFYNLMHCIKSFSDDMFIQDYDDFKQIIEVEKKQLITVTVLLLYTFVIAFYTDL